MILIPSVTEEHLLPPDGQCSGQQYWIGYDLYFTWTGSYLILRLLLISQLNCLQKLLSLTLSPSPSRSSNSLAHHRSDTHPFNAWCIFLPMDLHYMNQKACLNIHAQTACNCVHLYIVYICILSTYVHYVYLCVTCIFKKDEERSKKIRN